MLPLQRSSDAESAEPKLASCTVRVELKKWHDAVAPTSPLIPLAGNKLAARDVACRRGDRIIFRHVSFELPSGGLLQVSGHNGTGKTSLLRLVCGFIHPEEGTIEWNGLPANSLGDEHHRNVAYVGHLNAAKDELSPLENLRLSAELSALTDTEPAIHGALSDFGLNTVNIPCKALSQGQKRRLALARLRLSEGRVLWILDEPFAALDSDGIRVVTMLIETHLRAGGMALITTHQEVPIAAASVQRMELGT